MAIKDVLIVSQEYDNGIMIPGDSSLGLPTAWYTTYEEYITALTEKATQLPPPRNPKPHEVAQATNKEALLAVMAACGVQLFSPRREKELFITPNADELIVAGIEPLPAEKLAKIGKAITQYVTNSTLFFDGFENHEHRRDWRKLFYPNQQRRSSDLAIVQQKEELIDSVQRSNPLSGNAINDTSMTLQTAQRVLRKGTQTQQLASAIDPSVRDIVARTQGYNTLSLREKLHVVYSFNTAIIGVQKTIGEQLRNQGIPLQVRKVRVF